MPDPKYFVRFLTCCVFAACCSKQVAAHQAPYSIVYLDISPGRVGAELQIPLSELGLAYTSDVNRDPATLMQRMRPQLTEYILAHTHAYVHREAPWLVEVIDMYTAREQQIASGPPFYELRVLLTLKPQHNENTRDFMFDYDAVVHHVVNHVIFVAVRNDWETGRSDSLTADSNPMTIRTAGDNTVHPLKVSLAAGSWWQGVVKMFMLGVEHIREGTDHLLFLIALLFPSMLLATKKGWGAFGGLGYSLTRILRIVTAFTIGHSLTLLIGALGWVHLPAQPVEVLIAVSILVSAVHAVYPLFPGREMMVAAGFGLIHGLAFASVISQLNLAAGTLAVSVLGFNLGIEAMQLVVILLVIPWLILLSQTPVYRFVRLMGATLAAVAATGWITERVTGNPNFIGDLAARLSASAIWGILALAVTSVLVYAWSKFRTLKHEAA
jgi:hypothetical protein